MSQLPPGITLRAVPDEGDLVDARIVTHDALAFVADLVRRFRPRIREALAAREARQAKLDAGELLDFLPATADVRTGDWTVAPLPEWLGDRRVEITGPTDRKMIINALNSGANVFMADLEDSTAPTFSNLLDGQQNLFDAVRRTIALETKEKSYALVPNPAVLFVRPRGLHLPEAHVLVDGEPIPGALFDFGLFCFHNAQEQIARGAGPFFYLAKLESHLEARIWNDVFLRAEHVLGLPRGTIKATVLVETLPAAFEMHEILYELREHSAGLNCGRWDYIFSYIKKLAEHADRVLPDRAAVTMDRGFLRAYSTLLVQTCHRRGAHAMGGMAAQIPIKNDEAANAAAMAKVRADKLREVDDGHDGTWVAHPALVAVAKEVFDAHMPQKNQLSVRRDDVHVTAKDLLAPQEGRVTEDGLRHNVRVAIQYVEAWLRGIGCVPLYNLMEDAATAEIARAQVWQWQRHHAKLDGKTPVDADLVRRVVAEELAVLQAAQPNGRHAEAAALFLSLAIAPKFTSFLTLPAYDAIVAAGL